MMMMMMIIVLGITTEDGSIAPRRRIHHVRAECSFCKHFL